MYIQQMAGRDSFLFPMRNGLLANFTEVSKSLLAANVFNYFFKTFIHAGTIQILLVEVNKLYVFACTNKFGENTQMNKSTDDENFNAIEMGRRVREARNAAGLKQNELAVRSGVTQQTISILENGGIPNPECLGKIAPHINVTEAYLRYGDPLTKKVVLSHKVPLITYATLRAGHHPKEFKNIKDITMEIIAGEVEDGAFAIQIEPNDNAMITNNSYEISFYPGQIVVFTPIKNVSSNMYVIARNKKNNSTVFRKLIEDNDKFYLSTLASGFTRIEVEPDYELLGEWYQTIIKNPRNSLFTIL
jgi:transcriptional regulator with XRE-family HTH domain